MFFFVVTDVGKFPAQSEAEAIQFMFVLRLLNCLILLTIFATDWDCCCGCTKTITIKNEKWLHRANALACFVFAMKKLKPEAKMEEKADKFLLLELLCSFVFVCIKCRIIFYTSKLLIHGTKQYFLRSKI